MKFFEKYHLLAPDLDQDGLTGEIPNEEDPEPTPASDGQGRSYTQKDVDAQMAKVRRKYERELLKQQKENELKFQNFESRLENLASREPEPSAPEPADALGRLELLERRAERDKKELTLKIEQAKQEAELERQKRRDLERDQEIETALTAIGVPDKLRLAARRYFNPQVEWDEVEGKWLLKTGPDTYVPILDGVMEEIPDCFKPSRMQRGGAGTSVGQPAKLQKQKQLEVEQAKLKELHDKATRAGGRPAELLPYMAQKRKVEQMQAALG